MAAKIDVKGPEDLKRYFTERGSEVPSESMIRAIYGAITDNSIPRHELARFAYEAGIAYLTLHIAMADDREGRPG